MSKKRRDDAIDVAHTALRLVPHPSDPTKVLMVHTKSSIGPLGRTQVFSTQASEPCRTPGCPGTLHRDKRAVYCRDCRGRWKEDAL